MGHPLPVPRPGRGANASSVNVGEIHREARVPFTPAFSLLACQIGDIFHGRTKTRWADHGAIRTGQAAFRDIIPTRMLQVASKQTLHLGRRNIHVPSHVLCGIRHHLLGHLEIF